MSLEKILRPGSVAIIGASKDETKRGFQAIKTLLDEKYEGRIYPVNPSEKSILGLECYSRVVDVPEPVDLALIATPARTIPSIIEECGVKGVGGAVILAVGFGEAGEEGRVLENEIFSLARRYRVRIIGPNTSGMMNVHENLNLVGLPDVPKGDVALLTQSGNMALTLITEARLKSTRGFSYYVGVGNETDVRFHEYLRFFHDDPNTKVVLMYVEGMRQGRKFLQEAYRTTLNKPIILLKSGRSDTGKKSAGSHTGAMAGMSEVARSAFERAGIIVIEKSDQLFPAAEVLSCCPVIKNNSVAILADGGGHATIAADELTDLGLNLPELSDKTKEKLQEILPAAASVTNPVDVAGGTDRDPTVFAHCARILLKDPGVGGLLIVGLFGGYGIRFAKSLTLMEEDAAHQMGRIVKKRKKPIIMHSLYASEKTHPLNLLRYYDIPVYDSLEASCKGIGVLASHGNYLRSYHAKTNFVFNWGAKAKPDVKAFIDHARNQGRDWLLEHEAKKLLAAHGAPVSKDRLAITAEEAISHFREIGQPVAMKIVSPQIMHKSDARGVKVGLKNQDEVRKAFRQIIDNARKYDAHADILGVLVSPMARAGVEVIVGTKTDDQFGPVILFGLGGVMVEILKDVSFRVLPISANSAKTMMREIKSYPLLKGVRGYPEKDIKALQKLLLTISEIIESYPEIQEMDLNPVLVHPKGKGVTVVDARIILKAPEECVAGPAEDCD